MEPRLVLLPHTCILTERREDPASRSGSGCSQQELLFHSSLLLKCCPVFPSLARVGLECLWKCLLSVLTRGQGMHEARHRPQLLWRVQSVVFCQQNEVLGVLLLINYTPG